MQRYPIYSHTCIRGIAALAVLFYHFHGAFRGQLQLSSRLWIDLFDWADTAVNLFFILSGFILYWVYCNESDGVCWRKYFLARVARIVPLYYLTLVFFLILLSYSLIRYGHKFLDVNWEHITLAHLTMTSGVVFGPSGFNVPSWSVSVEMTLYIIVFPSCVFLIKKYPSRGFSLAVVLLGTVGMLACHLPWVPNEIMGWQWTWFFRGVFGFSCGFFLCYLFQDRKTINGILVDASLFAVVLLFAYSRYASLSDTVFMSTLPVLVYFSAYDKGVLCRLMKWKVFQWLGERSYSIYMWHWTVITLYELMLKRLMPSTSRADAWMVYFHVFAVVIIVMIVSEISFCCFEMPIRQRISARFHPRKSP